MGVVQQYARSLTTTNLKDDQFNSNTDALAAMALSSDMGGKLFRLKYGSSEANLTANWASLFPDWYKHVKSRSVKHEWPSLVDVSAVSRMSLNHWLNDVCKVCNGDGGSDDEEVCPACNGTGKNPVVVRNGRLCSYVEDMVDVLDAVANEAAEGMASRLGIEVDRGRYL